MKKVLLFVMLVVFASSTALAGNGTVKVNGDVEKNGKLLIDVDWTIDTDYYRDRKGKLLPPSKVREHVYEEMWQKTLPALVEKTEGYPVSFKDCRFAYIEEKTKMMRERSDRSAIYNIKLKLRFDVPEEASGKKIASFSKRTEHFEKLSPRFMGLTE